MVESGLHDLEEVGYTIKEMPPAKQFVSGGTFLADLGPPCSPRFGPWDRARYERLLTGRRQTPMHHELLVWELSRLIPIGRFGDLVCSRREEARGWLRGWTWSMQGDVSKDSRAEPTEYRLRKSRRQAMEAFQLKALAKAHRYGMMFCQAYAKTRAKRKLPCQNEDALRCQERKCWIWPVRDLSNSAPSHSLLPICLLPDCGWLCLPRARVAISARHKRAVEGKTPRRRCSCTAFGAKDIITGGYQP